MNPKEALIFLENMVNNRMEARKAEFLQAQAAIEVLVALVTKEPEPEQSEKEEDDGGRSD